MGIGMSSAMGTAIVPGIARISERRTVARASAECWNLWDSVGCAGLGNLYILTVALVLLLL